VVTRLCRLVRHRPCMGNHHRDAPVMWKYRAIVLTIATILFLIGAHNAQADSKARWSMPTPGCYKYRVWEWREGTLHLAHLYTIKMRVQWCLNPSGTRFYTGPTRHLNHSTNTTWVWNGWTVKRKTVLHNPVRVRFYAKASVAGLTAWPVEEHNYPWIRVTIWRNNPTHVSYTAGCGC
jgi:hypothetical protein